jgi:hypothetical protein
MTLKTKILGQWKAFKLFYDKHIFSFAVGAAVLFFVLATWFVYTLTPEAAVTVKTPTPEAEVVAQTTVPPAAKPVSVPRQAPVAKAKQPHKDLIIGGVKPVPEKTEEIIVKSEKVAEKTTKYKTEEDETTLQPDYKDSLKEYTILSGQQ